MQGGGGRGRREAKIAAPENQDGEMCAVTSGA